MSRTETLPPLEPLVASPKTTCHLLGIGTTKSYELLDAGELESFLDGTSRKITTRSIKAYIERKLADPAKAHRLEDA
jgi:excisionase family DNA binding protein